MPRVSESVPEQHGVTSDKKGTSCALSMATARSTSGTVSAHLLMPLWLIGGGMRAPDQRAPATVKAAIGDGHLG